MGFAERCVFAVIFSGAAVFVPASAGAQPAPPTPTPGQPSSTNEQLTDMVMEVIEEGAVAGPPGPPAAR